MRDYGSERANKRGPGNVPYESANFLRTYGYRVKKSDHPGVEAATKEIAGYALERSLQALAGEVDNDKEANAVLKASAQLREEMCEPVEKISTVRGHMTLEQLVAKATEPETK